MQALDTPVNEPDPAHGLPGGQVHAPVVCCFASELKSDQLWL